MGGDRRAKLLYTSFPMEIITGSAGLQAVCAQFKKSAFVAVDTEFIRESTYWPRLCLIQMAVPGREVIVDPLADGLDLAAFFDLMADENVVKVFHAARQDIEIIFHLAGFTPAPVFDTQIAAMVCGFGESVGYGMLVKKLLGRTIDKTSRFTDWARRPLSGKQLQYALGDVTHLREVYELLKRDIEKRGRESWLQEEIAALTARETYDLQPEEAWKRMKQKVRNKTGLAILMELAAWREREAQTSNVPRGRILKDEALFDIANNAPQTEQALSELRSVHNGFSRSRRGRDVLEAVRKGLARDVAELPELRRGRPLPAEAVAIVELLRVLLKNASAENGVAAKLIANAADLEKIAMDDEADVPALKGWRRELFGQAALDLKHGRLALAVQKGRLRLIQADGTAPGR